MADGDTKSKDGKGQGGCCSCCLGCAVLLSMFIAFLLGFYIVPTLRDNGWDVEVFPRKVREFRTRVGNKIDEWNERFIKVSEAIEDKAEAVEENAEKVADKVKKAADKAEDMVEPLIEGDLKPSLIED